MAQAIIGSDDTETNLASAKDEPGKVKDCGIIQGLPREVLAMGRRRAIKDPEKAAGRCERIALSLATSLTFLGYEAKAIAGWYKATKNHDAWARIWQGTRIDGGSIIDHAWVFLKEFDAYLDPTISQFGEGEGGLQIARRGDERYLLRYPGTDVRAHALGPW